MHRGSPDAGERPYVARDGEPPDRPLVEVAAEIKLGRESVIVLFETFVRSRLYLPRPPRPGFLVTRMLDRRVVPVFSSELELTRLAAVVRAWTQPASENDDRRTRVYGVVVEQDADPSLVRDACRAVVRTATREPVGIEVVRAAADPPDQEHLLAIGVVLWQVPDEPPPAG